MYKFRLTRTVFHAIAVTVSIVGCTLTPDSSTSGPQGKPSTLNSATSLSPQDFSTSLQPKLGKTSSLYSVAIDRDFPPEQSFSELKKAFTKQLPQFQAQMSKWPIRRVFFSTRPRWIFGDLYINPVKDNWSELSVLLDPTRYRAVEEIYSAQGIRLEVRSRHLADNSLFEFLEDSVGEIKERLKSRHIDHVVIQGLSRIKTTSRRMDLDAMSGFQTSREWSQQFDHVIENYDFFLSFKQKITSVFGIDSDQIDADLGRINIGLLKAWQEKLLSRAPYFKEIFNQQNMKRLLVGEKTSYWASTLEINARTESPPEPGQLKAQIESIEKQGDVVGEHHRIRFLASLETPVYPTGLIESFFKKCLQYPKFLAAIEQSHIERVEFSKIEGNTFFRVDRMSDGRFSLVIDPGRSTLEEENFQRSLTLAKQAFMSVGNELDALPLSIRYKIKIEDLHQLQPVEVSRALRFVRQEAALMKKFREIVLSDRFEMQNKRLKINIQENWMSDQIQWEKMVGRLAIGQRSVASGQSAAPASLDKLNSAPPTSLDHQILRSIRSYQFEVDQDLEWPLND